MANIYVNEDNIEDYHSDNGDEFGFSASIPGTSSADVITVDLPYDEEDYYNYGDSDYGEMYIDAKGGNDKISVKVSVASYVEIKGGKGNDTITNEGVDGDFILRYANGDGKDVVYGMGLVYLTSGSVSKYKISGNDHILSIGSGSITFKDYENHKNYIDGRTRLYVSSKSKSTFYIDGQAFNYVNATYTGAAEDDYTYNYSFKGTKGNDYINAYGEDNTINGGKGNDQIDIYGSEYYDKDIIQYASGDGDDTICYARYYEVYKYENEKLKNDEQPKIQITDGSSYSLIEQGTDILIKVGSGSMLVKYAAGQDLNITGGTLDKMIKKGTSGADTIYNTVSSIAINASGGNDTIYTSYTLDTENDLHYKETSNITVNAGNGDDYIQNSSADSKINGGAGNDTIYNDVDGKNSTLNGGDGDDKIYNCDSDLSYGVDSIIMIGGAGNDYLYGNGHKYLKIYGGSGNDTVKNIGYYSTLTGGKGNDIIYSSYKNVIQYSNGDGNDTIYNYGNDDTIQIAGSYSTAVSGSDVIITVGEGSMLLKNTNSYSLKIETVSSIDDIGDEGSADDIECVQLTNSSNANYTMSDDVDGVDASARTKAVKIVGNSNDNLLIGGSKNDTFTGGDGDDTFVSGLGKDIITDYAEEDTVSLTGAITKVSFSKKNVILNSGKNTTILKNVAGKKITFVDNAGNVTKQTFGVTNITIEDGDGASINTVNDATVITLNASARTENIVLNGNAKSNTLVDGKGSDTLTGGKGADVFYYSGGDDVITDYSIKQKDSIQLADTSITSYSVKDKDVIFTTSKGTLTVKNGKDASININGTTKVYGDPYEVVLAKGDKSTSYTADNIAITIDASKKATKVNIMGNDNNNIIKGTAKIDSLNGGIGDDTLTGGKGNDTLIGGSGADVFYYTVGDGNDIIKDYSATDGDVIQLAKNTVVNNVSISGGDFIFSIGKGKITVEGGATQTITVVNDSNVEMLYRTRNSDSGYQEKLFMDDNFVTNELDEIISSDSDLISGDLDLKNNFDQSNQIISINNKKKK